MPLWAPPQRQIHLHLQDHQQYRQNLWQEMRPQLLWDDRVQRQRRQRAVQRAVGQPLRQTSSQRTALRSQTTWTTGEHYQDLQHHRLDLLDHHHRQLWT